MLRTYYIAAIRSLSKNKVFSIVNVLGLSVGLATFVIIYLYVYREWNFDRYHKNANRIFRVVENLQTEREILYQSVSSPPIGPAMQRQFAEVENFVRFLKRDFKIRLGDKVLVEDDCYFTDSSIFKVFTFPLIRGNSETALMEPYSIVLSESTAEKIFGQSDPLDQSLEVNGEMFKVTGVVANVPETSHFRFKILASFSTWTSYNKMGIPNKLLEEVGWFINIVHTYVLLKDESLAAGLRAKMKSFIKHNIPKGGLYYEDLPLQPLTHIYLREPARTFENGSRGSLSNVYILSIIALFVLVTACFNYVNLATARASHRMKEVGMRKVLGAQKSSIIAQFLIESTVICVLAIAFSAVICSITLPLFNTMLGTSLSFGLLPPIYLIGGLGSLVFFLSIFSGLYPAFVISSFQPLDIFRPSLRGLFSNQTVRKVLVSTQFVISITLVAGTLLVFNQLALVQKRDLGWKKEATLLVQIMDNEKVRDGIETVKAQLLKVPQITSAAAANRMPGEQTTNLYTTIEDEDGNMVPSSLNTNFVDYDFLPAFEIPLIAGRNFSREFVADDSTAFIINESAMKHFGWTPESAIGKKVSQSGRTGKIIGVCRNFYYRSLHHNIEPLILLINSKTYNTIALKIKSEDMPAVVAEIQQIWKNVAPEYPFGFTFLDQDYQRLYKTDFRLGKIAGIFSTLAIFIGSLGLLGLTSFSISRRVKEIGVRKILGASVMQIILLMSKEFTGLIGIAFLISIPVTYYLISEWLSYFTEQIHIGGIPFIVAGISVLAAACFSVSFLSFRAATTNPTHSLRQE
ncbi:MAG TPA: ABC transporter permease [Cyclobacteriaceae bacterium]|nr:ABC transporter permease [Cyclobacteriaceae bacterium]